MNALQKNARDAAKRAAAVVAPHRAVFVLVADGASGDMAIASNREDLPPAVVATMLRAMADVLAPAGAPELDDPGADVVPIRGRS